MVYIDLEEVLCDKVCKKKKSCNVHKCEIKCCISLPNSLEHTCFEFCGRMLDCGVHPCPRKCHTGKCGECTIKVNQTLRCACGDKVIYPPVKCGTLPPHCNKRCDKVLPCGHSCLYTCHFGECKPCQEIVDKPCACGKKIVSNAICSMKMFCQNQCKNELPCGHVCGEGCHDEKCTDIQERKKSELASQGITVSFEGCSHLCGKKRQVCGHPCDSICHPNQPCPITPCKYMVKASCPCGNKSTFVECGCTDKKFIKELECGEKCKNLQRFKALYEKSTRKAFYPGSLVKLAKNNLSYIQKLEERLSELLLGGDLETMVVNFDKSSSEKMRMISHLLSKHYHLELLIYKGPKTNVLTVSKTADSIIPKVTLSQYLIKLNRGDMDVDEAPFDARIRFYELAYYEGMAELDKILVDIKDEYYAEVDRNNKVKLYVWNKESIPQITKRLQKSGTGFSQFEVEEYPPKTDEASENITDGVITKEFTEGEQNIKEGQPQEQTNRKEREGDQEIDDDGWIKNTAPTGAQGAGQFTIEEKDVTTNSPLQGKNKTEEVFQAAEELNKE